jgi:cytochrome c nitrite reductase small subunit
MTGWLKKMIIKMKPPPGWQLPVAILSGIFIGLAVYVFIISNAVTYLSDKPSTCINCHIMNPQFASWAHSSHREVAHCNDCHVPHNNVFNKYFFKAKDGLRHATMFTFRLEPQVIQIKRAGQKVVKGNCIRCHQKTIILPHLQTVGNISYYQNRVNRDCWGCHRETPHGRVNSLASFPNALVTRPYSDIPRWFDEVIKKTYK